MSGDMLQDAIVGRRGAARVMLRSQAVDRYHQEQGADRLPFLGNRSYGAGDQLHLHTHAIQHGQAIANVEVPAPWIAAYHRVMKTPYTHTLRRVFSLQFYVS